MKAQSARAFARESFARNGGAEHPRRAVARVTGTRLIGILR